MKRTLKTKLRIRFVLLSILSLTMIQGIIIGVSIYHNYQYLITTSDLLIAQLHNNPDTGNRFFLVRIPAEKDVVYLERARNVSVTKEQAVLLAKSILAEKKERGFIGGYRFCVYQNENGKKIYFLQRDTGIEMCQAAAKNLIVVSFLCLIGVGMLLIPASRWIVNPLIENHCRQKRFITSASHELRTPLTVISTNVQMLQLEIGDNEWLDRIQNQISYLTQMTNALVTLSKAEEYENPLIRETFCLSDALQDVAETYEVIARQRGIQFNCEIQENIIYYGNRAEVQQLLQILLDNACKYCLKNGYIHIKIKQNFQGVKLSVVNTADGLSEKEIPLLLHRFERGRNASGENGYGLGLSIAEAIATRHHAAFTISTDIKGNFCADVIFR